MHITPFRAWYPNLEKITTHGAFFNSLKEEYPEYFRQNLFCEFSREALYIYQIATPFRQYCGLVACLEASDYFEGRLRPHEHTLTEKLGRQVDLFRRRGAEVKPVLATYSEVPAISKWTRAFAKIQEPFLNVYFQAEEQRHRLWAVDDPHHLALLQRLFARHVPVSYIADGHHRTSSLAQFYEDTADPRFRRLLCAFFPSTDLDILEFNRVITPPTDLSATRILAELSGLFDIEALANPHKPTQKHEILMLLEQGWYLLRWKPAIIREYPGGTEMLDTMLLNEKVLGGVLGIRDVRNNPRVEYVEGPRGLEALIGLVARDDRKIGFCLYPVSLPDLMTLADRGGVLPPKSTWFEPRIRNGLVVLKY